MGYRRKSFYRNIRDYGFNEGIQSYRRRSRADKILEKAEKLDDMEKYANQRAEKLQEARYDVQEAEYYEKETKYDQKQINRWEKEILKEIKRNKKIKKELLGAFPWPHHIIKRFLWKTILRGTEKGKAYNECIDELDDLRDELSLLSEDKDNYLESALESSENLKEARKRLRNIEKEITRAYKDRQKEVVDGEYEPIEEEQEVEEEEELEVEEEEPEVEEEEPEVEEEELEVEEEELEVEEEELEVEEEEQEDEEEHADIIDFEERKKTSNKFREALKPPIDWKKEGISREGIETYLKEKDIKGVTPEEYMTAYGIYYSAQKSDKAENISMEDAIAIAKEANKDEKNKDKLKRYSQIGIDEFKLSEVYKEMQEEATREQKEINPKRQDVENVK